MRPRLLLHLPFAGGPQPDHSGCRKTSRVDSASRSTVAFQSREHFIRADLGLLKEARDFGERAASEFGLSDYARYQVRLAISEAVTNAIQHGSSSADSPIRIRASEEAGALVIEVLDTGRFVPRVTRRGEMPESGRGLEFMRLMMDQVYLHPGTDGTLLRLIKRLE